MTKAIIYLFVLLLTISCQSDRTIKNNASTNSRVTVFIHDDDSDSISRKNYGSGFYSVDTLGSTHGPMLFVRDTNRIELDHPLWFRQLKTQIPFLVFPGDTISIEKVENGNLTFQSRSNLRRNNELSFFPKLVRKTGFLIDPSATWSAKSISDLSIYFKSILEKRVARDSILNDERNHNMISNDFYESADRFIKYTYIDNKLDIIIWNQKLLKQYKLYEKYVDSCFQELVRLPFDSSFIGSNVYYKIVGMGTGHQGEIRSINDLEKSIDFVLAKMDGPKKEFLLRGLLYGAIFNIGVPESMIQQYDSISKNAYYKEIIHRTIEEQSAQIKNGKNIDKLLLSDYNTIKSLQMAIASNKGKLILLDFWASWCIPCMQEMPALKTLENKYTNQAISFYSISIDSKVNDWKSVLREEKITTDNNVLLLNAENSSFRQQYKISSIPRYMLIGKDGKMIASDAPRPSDKALVELINKNL